MSGVPQIFDPRLRRARRERAARDFTAHAFLAEAVREEIGERLSAIQRPFVGAVWCGAVVPPDVRSVQWIHADSAAGFVRGNGLVLDEERLPFADQSLELFASALTLHAVNDLPGALAQIRRALKPDGAFVGALFGGRTLQELRAALSEAEIEVEGGLSPRVAPFADVRDAGGLLQRAGFALPVADSDTLTVHYEHPLKLLADLRGMAETNVLNERRRSFMKRAVLQRACEIYLTKFAGADGRVRATFEIVYLTGWAPHDNQQKPLKPGSAQMRLSDALRKTSGD